MVKHEVCVLPCQCDAVNFIYFNLQYLSPAYFIVYFKHLQCQSDSLSVFTSNLYLRTVGIATHHHCCMHRSSNSTVDTAVCHSRQASMIAFAMLNSCWTLAVFWYLVARHRIQNVECLIIIRHCHVCFCVWIDPTKTLVASAIWHYGIWYLNLLSMNRIAKFLESNRKLHKFKTNYEQANQILEALKLWFKSNHDSDLPITVHFHYVIISFTSTAVCFVQLL